MTEFDRSYFGMAPKPIPGPLKVYQRDRFVGTVPNFPVVSTSFVFDVRPGDFTPEQRGGETILRAADNIGGGDFDCIKGFRRPDGSERGKGDIAEMFDALAKMAHRT